MVLAHNIDEGIRSKDIQISQDVTFQTMLLASNTLLGLRNSGFHKPSPVQLHGIPLGKCGFDLLLEAKSGTGKTAVFSVIALEKLDLNKGLQVVILAPTREIASQICDVIKEIGANYNGLSVEVVMGGLPVEEDVAKFKNNVHIVVGSPGRLRHLIQDKHINVCSVRLLVLDEADKLMEKSFLADVNYIFSILPTQKQVILSSATFPETTKTFVTNYVKCAQHICPDSNSVLLGIEQKITIVKSNTNIVSQTKYKIEELLKILSHKQFKQCLIFCNYQVRVNELYKRLIREKWPVEQLCGRQVQSVRLDALKTLQEYKCRILISTDLAARGIDASNVDLVINFEPPFEWQTYLHRIGRAGRYGSYGMAVTILGEGKEENSFKKMLELINIDTLKITNFWESHNHNEYAPTIFLTDLVPTSSVVSTSYEVEYKELWNTLIGDQTIEKEIDDFELLCKSFEETKQPAIESFTDLISSFKKENILKEDSSYQHLSIQRQVMKNVSPSIKCSEANDNNLNLENIKPNLKKTDKKSKCENFEILDRSVSNTLNENKLHKNNILVNNQHHYDFDENETKSSRALLEAGLPLSFGCSGKNRISKVNNKENKQRKNENKNFKFEQNYRMDIKSDYNKNTNTSQHVIKDTRNESFQDRHNEPNYTNKRHRGKKNDKVKAIFSQSKIKTVDSYYSQNYLDWYKQLKNSVKYMEIVMYMNEISTL